MVSPLPRFGNAVVPFAPGNRSDRTLVIIDASLEDYPSLVSKTVPGTEVVILESDRDGIHRISEAIKDTKSKIKSIHILSHGSPGEIFLGNSVLNTETLSRYAGELRSWREFLADDADILIYGCNVASENSAEQFIARLHQLTQANIAASKTLTGAPELGGVPGLEFQIGRVKTAAISMAEYSGVLAPAIGTTTFDSNVTVGTNQPSPLSGTIEGYTFTVISSDSNVSLFSSLGVVRLVAFGGGTWSEGHFASDNGSEFQLDNFRFSTVSGGAAGFVGDRLVVTGYRGGGIVAGATFTSAFTIVDLTTYTVDVSSNTAFDNVDEIRIDTDDGAGSGQIRIEDITISAAAAGDTTPPTFTSITRQTPTSSPTNADTLTFRATFNENVQNVDATDFAVTGTTATVTGGVTPVSASVYDITVSGGDLASFTGVVGLNLAGGQNIQDLALPTGNALPGTEPATDETYTLDNTPPGTPSVTSITFDTGISNIDQITNDTTLIFIGSAEPNSTVEIFIDGSSVGTTTAIGSGLWSFDHTGTTLGEGVYGVRARSTDAAGNIGTFSALLNVTIDTTAPAAPSTPDMTAATDTGSSNTDNITSDTTPDFTGTAEANSIIELFAGATSVGTTTADGSGNWTITASTLAAGNHNITATATDVAGNTSVASSALPITISTVPTVTLSSTGSPLAENGGVGTVTATLSNVAIDPVTVNLGFTGTATGGGTDYTASGTQIVIPVGSTTGNITVTGNNDALNEANETVIVDITGVTNGTESGTQQQTLTITDDDPTPTLSINDVTVNEGDGTATFTVTLSAASGQAVSVNYATANDTATAGNDYTTATGTLNFVAGDTSETVTVNITEDTLDEANETFFVNLSGETNATIADNQGIGTINDNDTAPTVSFTSNSQSVGENAGTATITAQLSAVSGQNVTVPFTINGSSTATGGGTDYSITASPITIPAGSNSASITVTLNNDAIDEANETVIVDMGTPTNATQGATTTHTLTITDDDTAPTISINDVTVNEGDGTATFTVTLSAASGQPVSVNYATANNTATAGNDYTNNTGIVNFAAGDTSEPITVSITDDALDEANETFFVNLSGATNATIADNQGIGTINDNDAAPTISINDVTVNEGDGTATFTVTLSAASGQAVSVNYATANNTATAGNDYTTATGTLNFVAGDTSEPITVSITDDALDEATETFFVDLSGATNATIADNQGQATITDNDPQPNVTLSIGGNFGENGGTTMLTATLDAASGLDVTVNLTYSGVAVNGTDYSGANSIVISAGSMSQSITLTGTDDASAEGDETVIVDITSVTNGIENGTQQVTAIVVDDDVPGVIITESGGSTDVTEGGTTDTYTVVLDTQPTNAVTIAIATGSQVDPITNLTFNPTGANLWSTPQTVTVTATDDTVVEGNHTQTITHTATSTDANYNGITIVDVTANIADNDIDYALTTSGDVTEGNSGMQTVTFTVTRSGDVSGTSSVDYAIAGTATDGTDYNNILVDGVGGTATGTINFAATDTTKTITVDVLGDGSFEGNEAIELTLSSPMAPGTATITDSPATITIINDDAPPNSAPVNTVPTDPLTGETNTSIAVSGISIADDSAMLTVMLAATNGTLTLSNTMGLTFTSGDGDADSTLAFSGSLAEINAALSGLSFTSTADFVGDASVQISTSDGVNTDADTVNITVTAATASPTPSPNPDPAPSPVSDPIVFPPSPSPSPTPVPDNGSDELDVTPNLIPIPAVEMELEAIALPTTGSGIITPGNDTVIGGNDGDIFALLSGEDIANLGAGNDTVNGNKGNDIISGGAGADFLHGGMDADTLIGGMDGDILLGDLGDDLIDGGDGSDYINGNKGRDRIDGGADSDTVRGGMDSDTLTGGTGDDAIYGDLGDDIAEGGDGADTILGGNGSDTLSGQNGNDAILGGNGVDILDGNQGADYLNGNMGADTLDGGEGNDTLRGGMDDDFILGASGDDLIYGDKGNDTLIGASGADTFVLRPGDGMDVIVDFEDGIDAIALPAGITFDDLTIDGTLPSVTIRLGDERLATVLSSVPGTIAASDFVSA